MQLLIDELNKRAKALPGCQKFAVPVGGTHKVSASRILETRRRRSIAQFMKYRPNFGSLFWLYSQNLYDWNNEEEGEVIEQKKMSKFVTHIFKSWQT